jgi:uncharacterized protein YndB with AHSA1/START domain
MARTETVTTASPQDVWDVLMDPDSYGHWVVGSSHIRAVDPDWPAPGSRFHHSVGLRPLTLSDHTCVVEIEPPRRLVLRAKARPLGTARVELILRPQGSGTHVTMIEEPGDLFSRLIMGNPVSQRLLKVRNEESLRRLRRLAEERAFRRRAAGAAAAA